MLFVTLSQPIIFCLFAYLGLVSAVVYFSGKKCGKLLKKKLGEKIEDLSTKKHVFDEDLKDKNLRLKSTLEGASVYPAKTRKLSTKNSFAKITTKAETNGLYESESFHKDQDFGRRERLVSEEIFTKKHARKASKIFAGKLKNPSEKNKDSVAKKERKKVKKSRRYLQEEKSKKKIAKEEKKLKKQENKLKKQQISYEKRKKREEVKNIKETKRKIFLSKVGIFLCKTFKAILGPIEVLCVVLVAVSSYLVNLSYNYGQLRIFYIIVWLGCFWLGVKACKLVAKYLLSFYNYIVKRFRGNERTKR